MLYLRHFCDIRPIISAVFSRFLSKKKNPKPLMNTNVFKGLGHNLHKFFFTVKLKSFLITVTSKSLKSGSPPYSPKASAFLSFRLCAIRAPYWINLPSTLLRLIIQISLYRKIKNRAIIVIKNIFIAIL